MGRHEKTQFHQEAHYVGLLSGYDGRELWLNYSTQAITYESTYWK